MSETCGDYRPMVLDRASVDVLKSPDYERFVLGSTVEPGLRLLLARYAARP